LELLLKLCAFDWPHNARGRIARTAWHIVVLHRVRNRDRDDDAVDAFVVGLDPLNDKV
jgi:hypothetical protein